jgi:hypothetical protein
MSHRPLAETLPQDLCQRHDGPFTSALDPPTLQSRPSNRALSLPASNGQSPCLKSLLLQYSNIQIRSGSISCCSRSLPSTEKTLPFSGPLLQATTIRLTGPSAVAPSHHPGSSADITPCLEDRIVIPNASQGHLHPVPFQLSLEPLTSMPPGHVATTKDELRHDTTTRVSSYTSHIRQQPPDPMREFPGLSRKAWQAPGDPGVGVDGKRQVVVYLRFSARGGGGVVYCRPTAPPSKNPGSGHALEWISRMPGARRCSSQTDLPDEGGRPA